MAINYPTSLDNFTNPTSSSPINSPSHADQHSNANDAIEALEAKVGVTGSTVSTSHDYRITQVESLVTSAVAGAKSIYQDVRNQSGSSLSKATPVYVSGSEGASGKMLISAASNSAESTSSKTMGITTSAIANNSNGQVISEGILEGIDTTGAADGDPVWLGTNGAKIYGLANKPSAPSHLVFLGVVIRGGQALTGSMYVKIQNGFELEELHNVQISSLINGNIIVYDSTAGTWKNTNTLQSTSSVVPLIVKGNGYSVNAFEMRNSSGELRAYINPYGSIVSLASANYFISDNPTNTVLTVKGISSQTANLTEWQNSSGTVLAKVDANGSATFTGSATTNAISAYAGSAGNYVFQGFNQSNNLTSIIYQSGEMYLASNIYVQAAANYNASVNIKPGTTSTSGIIIRGLASQTADLQQWQNSAGTVLSAITSSGDLNFNSNLWNIKANGTNVIQWQPTTGTTFFGYGLSNTPITVQGSSGQTADLQKWQDSTGAVMSKISSGGDIYAISRSVLARFIQADNGAGAYIDLGFNNANSVSIVGRTSTTAPQLIVKAIASQTTDLQQWQDSAGNVLSSIKTDGSLYISGNSNAKFISGPSTSGTNQIVSNGNDLAFSPYYDGLFAPANSAGRWRPVNDATSDLGTSGQRWKDLYATAGVFTNNSTTKVGLIVKAIASQTSDIFQIQNSSGNAMWYVNQYGQLIGNQPFYHYNTQYIGAPTASSVPLTVRGTTSQTANLQEWQTVDGTIALRMTDYGKLFSNYLQSNYGILTGGATYSGGYNFISNPTFATASTTLIIKAVTSQTADLQQWQNSAGTNLVSINAEGIITSSAKIMYLDGGTFRIGYGGGNIGSNLAIGNTSLNNNTTGTDNFALGSYAMYNTTTGGYNVAIGTGTLYWNVTGAGNTAIGSSALNNNTSSDNTAIGIMALVNSTSGYGNSGLGSGTLTSNTTANYNTAVGRSAGVMFTTGGNNTVVGATSFYHSSTTSTGVNNTALGYGAGAGNTGSSNLFLGYSAGSQETGSNKLYIANSNTATPLIGGDFSAKTLAFAGNTTITSQTAGTAGLIIYGASSQSVDLQQWKNNGGTTLVRINQYGDLYVTGGRIFRGPNDFGANLNISNESDLVGITIKGHTSQTVNLQEWQNSSATVVTRITSGGGIDSTVQITGRSAVTAGTGNYLSASLSVVPLNAAIVGEVIKAYPSQSAALQQWQDSAGSVLAQIGAGGDLFMSIATRAFFGGASGAGYVNISSSGNGGRQGLIIQGAASQTVNLQEWQNSSGTILTSVSKDGFVSIGAGSNTTYSDLNVWKSGEAAIDIVNTNWKSSSGRNAGQINFRVGGNTGERNNAVSAIRGLDLYAGGSYLGGLSFLTQGGGVADPVERARITNDGYLLVNTTSISAQLASVSAFASVPPLVIQHAASPTSSYFEIRSSLGTAIWGINSAGEALTRTTTKFGANIQNDSNNNNNALNVSAPSSSGTGIALYVYSGSTTRDIAKFDNNGTVKLTITTDGSLKGGNSNTISANTATTVDTVALSSFTTIEYVVSIKQGSKIRSSKVLVHTDGTSVDSTEYGIMEMGGVITGILVTASVSGTDSILQVTITDAATTNATVKLIKTML